LPAHRGEHGVPPDAAALSIRGFKLHRYLITGRGLPDGLLHGVPVFQDVGGHVLIQQGVRVIQAVAQLASGIHAQVPARGGQQADAVLGAFHEHVNMAQYGLIVIRGGEFADGR
jgi:hypothetical protein